MAKRRDTAQLIAEASKLLSSESDAQKYAGLSFLAMAKRRDTAQLIAEASKLLSSESDAQKYAGLSFLNAVASDPEGSLRKEYRRSIKTFMQ